MSETVFNVILVGAGDINFGTVEGPWNHSARLETLLGDRLRVLGIIDPDTARSNGRIAAKQEQHKESVLRRSWAITQALPDVESAAEQFSGSQIDLVLVGCPPQFRGTPVPGHDTETAVLRALPNTKGVFIEKPVASIDPSIGVAGEDKPCLALAKTLEDWQGGDCQRAIAVGYMFRYLSASRKIREILDKHNLVPRMINARYFMAYASTSKASWWSKTASGGPIVEQATHLVDLIRFIACGTDESSNPIDMDSLQATTVEHTDAAGKLMAMPVDESKIPPHDRLPRATAAFWRHAKGTLVTLCHSIALHDNAYHAEIEVLADGWLLQLFGIYTGAPRLVVRSPDGIFDEEMTCLDDPFETELAAIIGAVEGKKGSSFISDASQPSPILSSFRDALCTYELTWAIRHASERSLAQRNRSSPMPGADGNSSRFSQSARM